MPIFTIGHGTRSLAELVALLQESGVAMLADVRSFPRSRKNPQFNIDTLPASLAAADIGYQHFPALGGRRGRQALGQPSPNGHWRNDSFRNYADYTLTPPFSDGLATLKALAHDQLTAFMCAETAWQRCHRQVIADYLVAHGEDVRHIIGPGRVDVAVLNPAARPQPDGRLYYPPAQPSLL